ncbi:hypothetical protein F4806DRAFT_420737 [Annulohypoxylon nitens]|nr:hypothetical protein F4806DRAFT_420737 [Annulohypoxylon nitens]
MYKMLPDQLKSTFRQYKQDTSFIATWLAVTAKDHGRQIEHPNSNKSGRQKGKARTLPEHANRDYVIPIRDFIPLAEFVRDCEPAIEVPMSLSAALRRAIKLRGEFSGLLRESGYDLNVLATKSHEHFVGILARVCNILQPRMTFGRKPSDEGETAPEIDNGFENYFGCLSCEDQSPEQSDDNTFIPDSDFNKINYTAKEDNNIDDVLFALYQVMGDINEIRTQLIETWDQVFIHNTAYSPYPLTSAAMLTSLGIELARDLMEGVSQICEKHGGIHRLIGILFAATAAASGLPQESMQCYKSYYMVTPIDFLSLYPKDSNPIAWELVPEKVFPLGKNNSGRGTDSTDVEYMLLEYWVKGSKLHAPIWEKLIKDHISEATSDQQKLRRNPVHIALASQIYLDLHHRYGEKVIKAYETMTSQLAFMQKELQNCRTFEDARSRSKRQQKKAMSQVTNMLDLLDGIMSPHPGPNDQREFLKRNPLVCGLILVHFQSALAEYGLGILNADPTVISGVHLYNALGMEDMLHGRWPDIELLLTLMSKSAFFIGEDRPSSRAQYEKRYLLQIGSQMSAFAPNYEGRKKARLTLIQRKVESRSNLMQLIVLRRKNEMTSGGWSKDLLESLINTTTYKEVYSELRGESGNIASCQVSMTSDEIMLRDRETTNSKKAMGDKTSVSVKDLLLSLRKVLVIEMPFTVFPYLTILHTTRTCLEKVRAECEPQLQKSRFNYSCEPQQNEHFISYLFGAAAERKASTGPDFDILECAARVVNEFTSSELASKARRQLSESLGFTFTETNGFMACEYHNPPRPSEEDIIRLRKWTQVEELFADNGDDGGNSGGDGDQGKQVENDEVA